MNDILYAAALVLLVIAGLLLLASYWWPRILPVAPRRLHACITGIYLLSAVLFAFSGGLFLAAVVFVVASLYSSVVIGVAAAKRKAARAARKR